MEVGQENISGEKGLDNIETQRNEYKDRAGEEDLDNIEKSRETRNEYEDEPCGV